MKKILLVADFPGWIFERHCKEIQKRITEYEIDIAFHRQDINGMSRDYDLVYILDPMPLRYPPPEKTILGLRNDFLFREHPEGARGLYKYGFPGRCVSIRNRCCIFHVVNKSQLRVFGEVVTDKPLVLAQHGIDESCFDRAKYEKKRNDVLVVGTAGRGNSPGHKGFNLVKKACEQLGMQYRTTSYYGKRLSKEQMPKFYNDLDIYCCMSVTEGLHNPTIESGAMGVPVISTKCGASKEMITDGISGFIIKRDIGALVEALKTLRDDDLRLQMGDKFHEEIMKNWTWKVRIEDFRNMFNMFFEVQK